MRPDDARGGTFTEYELTDDAKTSREPSAQPGDDSIILVVARAGVPT